MRKTLIRRLHLYQKWRRGARIEHPLHPKELGLTLDDCIRVLRKLSDEQVDNILGRKLHVLVACEESQTVCKAFRDRGHIAFSCDLQECSGGYPEWHIIQDCLPLINGDCKFNTQDGKLHEKIGEWDLLIAHPPCTYMSKAGARWMYPTAGNLDKRRYEQAMEAKKFFHKFLDAKCKHIAVENPVPLKIVGLPQHSCCVQPYEYGEPFSKKTLLWLKDLPSLRPTNILTEYKPYLPSNTGGAKRGQKHSRGIAKNAKESSKTFRGIAEAMAEQWENYILNKKNNEKKNF